MSPVRQDTDIRHCESSGWCSDFFLPSFRPDECKTWKAVGAVSSLVREFMDRSSQTVGLADTLSIAFYSLDGSTWMSTGANGSGQVHCEAETLQASAWGLGSSARLPL